MFKEQHRVGCVEGPGQQALGIRGECGVGDHQARHMEEPRFVGLAVKGTCSDPTTSGHAHHHIGILSPTPMQLGQVVDDLIETARHKVSELHLDHGLHSGNREAESRPDDGAFAQRRIAHAVFAKPVDKTIRHLEDTAIMANVLSHKDEVIVAFHGRREPFGDGVNEPQLFGL